MSVLLGHNLKIFVTENVDNNGVVKLTNLTSNNTKELLVTISSFIYSQETMQDVVDLSLNIVEGANNDGYAGGFTKAGSLTMRCLLNSSKTDGLPFDKILWDSLTKTSTYPIGWTTTATTKLLPLNRSVKNLKPFGIIAVVDNIAYVFDNCRVAEASIQLDIQELAYVGWSLAYTRQRRFNNVTLTNNTSIFLFTGTLTGQAERIYIDSYNLAAAKLMRTTVLDRSTNVSYQLASINSAIMITNAHIYLDNVNMGENIRTALFAGAGNFAINSTVSFYTRGAGDSYTLVNHLINNEIDSTQKHEYKVTIDVLNTGGTDLLAQIVLDGVRMTLTEAAGPVLSATANLKVFKSTYNVNSGIKFCS